MSKLKLLFITAFLGTVFFSFIAKADVSEETAYILNSLLYIQLLELCFGYVVTI